MNVRRGRFRSRKAHLREGVLTDRHLHALRHPCWTDAEAVQPSFRRDEPIDGGVVVCTVLIVTPGAADYVDRWLWQLAICAVDAGDGWRPLKLPEFAESGFRFLEAWARIKFGRAGAGPEIWCATEINLSFGRPLSDAERAMAGLSDLAPHRSLLTPQLEGLPREG